jgi:hypothetical protein
VHGNSTMYLTRDKKNMIFFFSFFAVKSYADDTQNGMQILSKNLLRASLVPVVRTTCGHVFFC